jgi:ribosome biogenesis protein MAK21
MAKRQKSSSKTQTRPPATANGLPSFDESALNALTEEIEQGFNSAKSSKGIQKQKQKLHNQGDASGGQNQNSQTLKSNTEPHGKKRDAQGNIKKAKSENIPLPTGAVPPKSGKSSIERDALLKEILALGGTEEDLDLVADAVSDDDSDSSEADRQPAPLTAADKRLKQDLAEFVAGLGIDTVIADDKDEPDVDETDDWEDDPFAASSVEDVEPQNFVEEPELPVRMQAEASSTLSKDSNRLVSTF